MVYIDYLRVTFDDKYIEESDLDRSTAIALFQRIFGEHQKAVDGFQLDTVGTRPTAYGRGTEMSEFEKKMGRLLADLETITAGMAGIQDQDHVPSLQLLKPPGQCVVKNARFAVSCHARASVFPFPPFRPRRREPFILAIRLGAVACFVLTRVPGEIDEHGIAGLRDAGKPLN